MTNRAINLDALFALVNDLIDRADELLLTPGDSVNDSLYELGGEIQRLSVDLATAETALYILRCLFGTRAPGDYGRPNFGIAPPPPCRWFGERFAWLEPSGTDGPPCDVDMGVWGEALR